MGRAMGGGSSRWRKHSPAISCSSLICTVQLQTPGRGTARRRYPPAVAARLCPAAPCLCPAEEGCRGRGGRTAAPCIQARKSQTVKFWVFSNSRESKWFRLQRKPRSVWPCWRGDDWPWLVSSGESPEWCHKQLMWFRNPSALCPTKREGGRGEE